MKIQRSYDVENEVRKALSDYFTMYVRPLPAKIDLPSLLITQVGGSDNNDIDNTDIVIDCRAQNAETAMNTLLDAIAILKAVAQSQQTTIRYATLNSAASWGNDPVRPELSLCSARLTVYTHKYTKEIDSL